MAINPNKICLNTLFLMHGLATCICSDYSTATLWRKHSSTTIVSFFAICEVILISSHLSPSVSPCVPVFGADYSTDSFERFPFCNLWDLRSHLSQLVSPQLPAAVPRLYFPFLLSSKWLSSMRIPHLPLIQMAILPTSSTCSSSFPFFRLKQFECGDSGWN